MDAVVTGLVGALIVLMLGWVKLDLRHLSDRIDALALRIDDLAQRISRIEGRLDEREPHGQ